MNPMCLSIIRTFKKKDPVSGVRAVRHEHFKICSTSVELKILLFQVYRSGRVVQKKPRHIIKHGGGGCQTLTIHLCLDGDHHTTTAGWTLGWSCWTV